MSKRELQPEQRTTPDEVEHLGMILSRCGQPVTGRDLLLRGGRYRLVDRTMLMKEVLRLVEVFVEDRVRQADAHMRGLLERREGDAREEGRMRVLVSLAELGDLVDSIVGSVASETGTSATKALDKRLDRIFRSYGFERTESVGAPFDPALHEALDERFEEGVSAGTILEELSRGYRKEKFVLRVARVVVASQAPDKTPN